MRLPRREGPSLRYCEIFANLCLKLYYQYTRTSCPPVPLPGPRPGEDVVRETGDPANQSEVSTEVT